MVRSRQTLVSVVVAVRPWKNLLFAFEFAASSDQNSSSFVAGGLAGAAASVVEFCYIYKSQVLESGRISDSHLTIVAVHGDFLHVIPVRHHGVAHNGLHLWVYHDVTTIILHPRGILYEMFSHRRFRRSSVPFDDNLPVLDSNIAWSAESLDRVEPSNSPRTDPTNPIEMKHRKLRLWP